MGLRRALEPLKNKRGVAMFMVMSTVTVLALLVSEFTYLAQVNQRMAYDRLDQLKAFYLAKSAYKLSLLRLKAYQNVKGYISSIGGKNAASAVPQQMLNQIWSFPFIYPIPSDLPGLTMTQKDMIETFQKESGLEGEFTALIESESNRYNLNLLLPRYAPANPTNDPQKTKNPSGGVSSPDGQQPDSDESSGAGGEDGKNKDQLPAYDLEAARKNLFDLLFQVLSAKFEADEDFATEYRDFRLEDLTENIIAWADRTYESKSNEKNWDVAIKKAPFFSTSELHMIPPMDEKLYQLFEPVLTVSPTTGLNVNTIDLKMFRALFAKVSKEEAEAFLKFRDSAEEDNHFKSADDFYAYLKKETSGYSSDDDIKALKEEFSKRGIRVVTEESDFRITVRATVNQATKTLEATVSMDSAKPAATPQQPTQPAQPPPSDGTPPLSGPGGAEQGGAPTGLRITSFRIL